MSKSYSLPSVICCGGSIKLGNRTKLHVTFAGSQKAAAVNCRAALVMLMLIEKRRKTEVDFCF